MDLENFKYNLSGLAKCNQYWDEMDPVAGGRHCNKCDKKIVDFSKKSFSEIAIFMSEHNEPVCGFYLPEQLEQMKMSKRKLPVAISLATVLAASTISRAEKAYNSVEQHAMEHKPAEDVAPARSSAEIKKQIDTIYLTGNVQSFDTTKKINVPISYASVIIKGTQTGVLTTANGNFTLAYAPSADSGTIYLVISCVGFEIKEIPVACNKQKEISIGTITLDKYKGGITEFYVTAKKRSRLSRFWRKITKPFRK